MKRRGRIIVFVLCLLILAIICAVVSLSVLNNTRLTDTEAQDLLQQVADTQYDRKIVTNVTLSSPLCTEAVLGTACRVDVNFQLGGTPAAGWCTFGLNQPRQCGITGIINP